MTTNDKKTSGADIASIYGLTTADVKNNVDTISQENAYGSMSSAYTDNLYGINATQTPPAVQINKDYFGFAFFTRPDINLTSDNISADRSFVRLLTKEPYTIERVIRCTLDPRLAKPDSKSGKTAVSTPLVDPQQAFIPILTNNLITISGWPDLEIPTRTTRQGMYKEEHIMVDGIMKQYGAYDVTASFRNLPGDPITKLLYYWSAYASNAYEGIFVPYPDNLIQNKIDSNTRIYRLILDSTKTKVQKLTASGVSIIGSLPTGASSDIEAGRPINNAFDQISVTFKCSGFQQFDDILIQEFNRTVVMHNDAMNDRIRNSIYRKLQPNELPLFNNRAYPRINPDNLDLEWWIDRQFYNSKLGK